jgi:CheY-like chemotaxis protein
MTSILVIEDDSAMRTMLVELFENFGYDVGQASNGREGLELFEKSPFEIVVTDLIMPEKEGIETIRQLRQDYLGVKIIAISGGGRGDPVKYLSLAKSIGADEVFAKPFKLVEIASVVKNFSGGLPN